MNTWVSDIELSSDSPANGLLGLAERGYVPDSLLRLGIRRMCRQRLREESAGGVAAQANRMNALVDQLRDSPVAIHADAANEQHYELPAAFFQLCLGPRLKYSCCYYPEGNETLDEAEKCMLGLYCDRAELADGQDILELGCGWGSLTLWMAERYPNARITAVSNSASQRHFIQGTAEWCGLKNVRVITQDVNALSMGNLQFDRCVSIEMFEHLRNYQRIMNNISRWLKPGGKLFVHHFAHRTLMYPFETEGDDNWLGRHFFTGGLMPAADTLLWFQGDLNLERRWIIDGTHYQRSANQWLERQDAAHDAVTAVLHRAYGDNARLWFQRWRMFWMACAELFGLNGGQDWLINHCLFGKPE